MRLGLVRRRDRRGLWAVVMVVGSDMVAGSEDMMVDSEDKDRSLGSIHDMMGGLFLYESEGGTASYGVMPGISRMLKLCKGQKR